MKPTPIKAFLALFISLAFPGVAAAVDFHFEPVNPGIFRGSEPQSPADYDALARAGVRTVLSLQIAPRQVRWDHEMARQRGMRFVHVPMQSTFRPPSADTVTRALDALNAAELRPIFVHCHYGQDRTGLVVGLHRVHAEHWTPAAAWQEMIAHHFNTAWYVSGLLRYFVRDTGYVPPGAPFQAWAPIPDSFPEYLPVAPPASAFVRH